MHLSKLTFNVMFECSWPLKWDNFYRNYKKYIIIHLKWLVQELDHGKIWLCMHSVYFCLWPRTAIGPCKSYKFLTHLLSSRFIKGYDKDNWVNVDSETGQVSVAKVMDRESPFVNHSTYSVIVYAVTKGKTWCMQCFLRANFNLIHKWPVWLQTFILVK